MTIEELNYKLTGIENPRYLTSDQKLVIEHCLVIINEIEQNSHKHVVMQGLPSFAEILREEFLINTQNYPAEYHRLFIDKFSRAKRRHEELSSSPSVGKYEALNFI